MIYYSTKLMVGAAGIEPATPTMSTYWPPKKCRKINAGAPRQSAIGERCSLFGPGFWFAELVHTSHGACR